jgi:threonine dehydrogenase-like Zn-dependent dehydrogenase
MQEKITTIKKDNMPFIVGCGFLGLFTAIAVFTLWLMIK